MKAIKTISILALAILLFGATTVADAQQKAAKEPKTVLDFYLLLPEEYLTPLSQIKDRQSLIKTKDIANGYLTLEGAGTTAAYWEGWGEIALFKKRSGDYVVGVVDGSNATMHYSGIEFYEYGNSKWRKITNEIFPDVSSVEKIKFIRGTN